MAIQAAAAEVTAAWIAAAVAATAAVMNVVVTLWVDRKRRGVEATLANEQRNSELMLAVLAYFQGSQRRSVGIAALAVLRERPVWIVYRETVTRRVDNQLCGGVEYERLLPFLDPFQQMGDRLGIGVASLLFGEPGTSQLAERSSGRHARRLVAPGAPSHAVKASH